MRLRLSGSANTCAGLDPRDQQTNIFFVGIHNNESYGSDTDSLLDLDELLVSSFDPDISENEEEVGGQENAKSLGLELSPLSLRAIYVGYQWKEG